MQGIYKVFKIEFAGNSAFRLQQHASLSTHVRQDPLPLAPQLRPDMAIHPRFGGVLGPKWGYPQIQVIGP